MIRCKKCGIDYDLCPCKDEPAKSNLLSAYGGFIFFLIMLWLMVGATSCNTEKRATRLIQKGERINPNSLTIECAKRFRGIDSVDTRIEYRQGETITDTILTTEIEIVRDTVLIKATKVITNTIHDTVEITAFKQLVNTAAVDSCKVHGQKETARANKAEQSGKMWKNIAIGLMLAIALFFVIRFVIGKFR